MKKFHINTYQLILSLIILVTPSFQEKSHIDVMAKLSSKVPDCNLRSFVKQDKQFELLKADLSKYCSSKTLKSDASIPSEILCRMIYSGLKGACKLPLSNRPIPTNYNQKITSARLCSIPNINVTNTWIWKKLGIESAFIDGINADNLCQNLMKNEDLIYLVRFFYKIAPLVREADLSGAGQGNSSPIETNNSMNQTLVSKDQTSSIKENRLLYDSNNVNVQNTQILNETINRIGDSNNKPIQITATASNNSIIVNVENKNTTVSNITTDLGKTHNETTSNIQNSTNTIDRSNINSIDTNLNMTNGTKESQKIVDALKTINENSMKTTDLTMIKKDGNQLDTNNNNNNDDDDKFDIDQDNMKKSETQFGMKESSTNNESSKDLRTNEQIPKPNLENNSNNNKDTDKTNTNGEKKQQEISNSESTTSQTLSTNTSQSNNEISTQKDNTIEKKDENNAEQIPVGKNDVHHHDEKNENKDNEIETKDENQDENQDENENEDQDKGDDSQLDNNGSKKGKLNQHDNREKDGKTSETEKKTFSQPVRELELSKRPRYPEDEGWSGSFVTYFLLFTLLIVVGYLILHNKNKVLGLLIEGCRRDRSSYGRRTGGNSSLGRYQRISQSS